MSELKKCRLSSVVSYYHGNDLIATLDGRSKTVNVYAFDVPTPGRAAALASAMLDILDAAGFMPVSIPIGAFDIVQDELALVIAGHSVKRVEVKPEPEEGQVEAPEDKMPF